MSELSGHYCYTPNKDESCIDGWLESVDSLGREVSVLCQCECHQRSYE